MQSQNNITNGLDWDLLIAEDLRQKRVSNPDIYAKYGVNVWAHTPGIENTFLQYEGKGQVLSKEVNVGETRSIIAISNINGNEMLVTLSGMVDASIVFDKEKSFFRSLGMEKDEFVSWIKFTPGAAQQFIEKDLKVTIETVRPYTLASLSKGYTDGLRDEFFNEIRDPSSAYVAKIIRRNGGGFLVNVSGIEGFLPGSLAAANVVRDFDSMIGKEIYVMVEDYLRDAGTFVFSHKKYLSHILPIKIEELSTEEKYAGTITGTAKFGIFVEFNEIFTGLIHTSKMTPAMREDFKAGAFEPGQLVYFWIKEISADKKIILTDEDPSVRQREIEDFKEKNLGIVTGGEVVSVQPFGTLVKLQKDIVGLISQKEIKTKKKKYAIGERVMVTVERVHNDKIFLTIPNED